MSYDQSRSRRTAERLARAQEGAQPPTAASREEWRRRRKEAESTESSHLESRGFKSLGAVPLDITLERILGRNNLVDIDFFRVMEGRAKAVCMIELSGGGSGTGWLISESLLLTNNHVLDSRTTAAGAVACFGCDQRGDKGFRYKLDPDRLFITSPDDVLDYTVVALRKDDEDALRAYGALPLAPAVVATLALGEPVSIIQHPNGEHKQYAVRENEIVGATGSFLHYRTDTNPGSSGSPVLDWQWRAVALHHSGVPREVNGKVVTRDGRIWQPSMGDNAIDWIANEGVRIDAILKDLREKATTEEARRLIARLPNVAAVPDLHIETRTPDAQVTGQPPPATILAPRPPAPDTQAPDLRPPAQSPPASPLGSTASGATVTASFMIPIHLQVSIGVPQASGGLGAPGVVQVSSGPGISVPGIPQAPSSLSGVSLDEAFERLERVTPETYYNAAEDAEDRARYYEGLDLENSDKGALFDALSDRVASTHTTSFSYSQARVAHLYPHVDLVMEDGKIFLRSLYTGQKYTDVRSFVREAYEVTERFEAAVRELRAREASLDPAFFEASLEALEAQAGFNCEHVVPQSWFKKRKPMVSDLHHLFTCDSRCNSRRGNYPLTDFPDYPDGEGDDPCGKLEGKRFEPRQGKGAAARAILYFLTRYAKTISRGSYSPYDIDVLKRWHEAEPPGDWERHRNADIFKLQGNRNPFIDEPSLARRVDLTRGLNG